MAEIDFAPVTEQDLPLLLGWLAQPHWQEWWGGDIEAELSYWRDMIADRDSTRPYMLLHLGRPIGYIQYWLVRDAMLEPSLDEAAYLSALPEDAVGVDLSIGPADLLSRGIGSRALAAFVADLRAKGYENIIIDPDSANIRAIRAYEKAGFRPIPEFAGRSGDCLLMRHHKES